MKHVWEEKQKLTLFKILNFSFRNHDALINNDIFQLLNNLKLAYTKYFYHKKVACSKTSYLQEVLIVTFSIKWENVV